mgnify:CR=1 FL=1
MSNDKKIIFKSTYYQDDDRKMFYKALNDFMREFGCYYIGYVCEDLKTKKRLV